MIRGGGAGSSGRATRTGAGGAAGFATGARAGFAIGAGSGAGGGGSAATRTGGAGGGSTTGSGSGAGSGSRTGSGSGSGSSSAGDSNITISRSWLASFARSAPAASTTLSQAASSSVPLLRASVRSERPPRDHSWEASARPCQSASPRSAPG